MLLSTGGRFYSEDLRGKGSRFAFTAGYYYLGAKECYLRTPGTRKAKGLKGSSYFYSAGGEDGDTIPYFFAMWGCQMVIPDSFLTLWIRTLKGLKASSSLGGGENREATSYLSSTWLLFIVIPDSFLTLWISTLKGLNVSYSLGGEGEDRETTSYFFPAMAFFIVIPDSFFTLWMSASKGLYDYSRVEGGGEGSSLFSAITAAQKMFILTSCSENIKGTDATPSIGVSMLKVCLNNPPKPSSRTSGSAYKGSSTLGALMTGVVKGFTSVVLKIFSLSSFLVELSRTDSSSFETTLSLSNAPPPPPFFASRKTTTRLARSTFPATALLESFASISSSEAGAQLTSNLSGMAGFGRSMILTAISSCVYGRRKPCDECKERAVLWLVRIWIPEAIP